MFKNEETKNRWVRNIYLFAKHTFTGISNNDYHWAYRTEQSAMLTRDVTYKKIKRIFASQELKGVIWHTASLSWHWEVTWGGRIDHRGHRGQLPPAIPIAPHMQILHWLCYWLVLPSGECICNVQILPYFFGLLVLSKAIRGTAWCAIQIHDYYYYYYYHCQLLVVDKPSASVLLTTVLL